jgi:D-alanyl-lipoteichoic acid acyltransferase DltB (MBOAT superfamily)
MLFNSFEFLLVFLPIVTVGFFLIGRTGSLAMSLVWLVAMSLVFHSYWKASYTWLLVATIVLNYLLAEGCRTAAGTAPTWRHRCVLIVGLTFNIALLAYFKYAGFGAEIIGRLTHTFIHVGDIVLPLAISFYTFQILPFWSTPIAEKPPDIRF